MRKLHENSSGTDEARAVPVFTISNEKGSHIAIKRSKQKNYGLILWRGPGYCSGPVGASLTVELAVVIGRKSYRWGGFFNILLT